MGEVYLAEHLALQRLVAVKVLPPTLGGAERIGRFLKEARMCSRVEHPNVVVIHDVAEQEGLHYIVMQYVDGKNLAELVLDQGGTLPWRSAVRVVQLAAKGLHAVHSHGLVHRDVKPSNIMLSADSRVILMDFGLVREEESGAGQTEYGHVVGTPWFMSPEQCRGEVLDRRSDIYSLGSTLYYLLTGSYPFPGTSSEAVRRIGEGERPMPVTQRNPAVPRKVEALVENAMAPRPRDRFATAALMAQELKSLLRGSLVRDTSAGQSSETTTVQLGVPTAAPVELLPLETRWETWQTRLPWIGAGGGMILCLALLALVLLAFRKPGSEPPQPPPLGMAYIEPGFARLGNDEAKLRNFLTPYLPEQILPKVLKTLCQERPARVQVPAFWIDEYEVTNAEYARFLAATGREPPEYWHGGTPPAGKEDHPVVEIRYEDAEAYARWAGKMLPTREQWLRAFRGDHDWLFPWGDEYEAGRANVSDNPKFPGTCPVKATPRDVSPFGVYNLVGNVCEFLRDWYHRDGQDWHVGKGAEYKGSGFVWGVGCAQYLYDDDVSDKGLGFRCVVEKPPAQPAQ
jgi:formylglycine-generating enzyme required for sulfatase activity